MKIPPFFRQETESTCSLAVLRMVLQYFGRSVTEQELEEKVIQDYGKKFQTIWNPTIAKLACEFGVDTTLCADWPLLKEGVLQKAMEAYRVSPSTFNVQEYENPNDKDRLSEPLPLAYKELFLAVEKGCHTHYGRLTEKILKENLHGHRLLQTSIKLQNMYPGSKNGYHSILLYAVENDTVYYHDPSKGPSLQTSIHHLLQATTDVGAFMIFQRK